MNQRKHKRIPVNWTALSKMEIDIFEQSFLGTIKDITPDGAFFCPDYAYFNNVPLSHKRYMAMFKTGDEVRIKSGRIKTTAYVVWKGDSAEHKCQGVGLRFK